MTLQHIEILVEEPSMEAFLRPLLPKIVGELSFEIYRHQGKAELIQRLPARMLGYASWLPDNWRVVVVVDRDDDDCATLKSQLEEIAKDAGLKTRSAAKGKSYAVINRIAIEELEAWYFGDWPAVRKAYPKISANVPSQAAYRLPDEIKGGTWEAFERVLQKVGYFQGGLRKIEAARDVAPYIDPAANRSKSFCVFRDALSELVVA